MCSLTVRQTLYGKLPTKKKKLCCALAPPANNRVTSCATAVSTLSKALFNEHLSSELCFEGNESLQITVEGSSPYLCAVT